MSASERPPSDLPDAALVHRARRGDEEAFAELVRRWQRPLMARALAAVGRVEDADDLVQETFLRAFRHLDRLRDPGSFGSWCLSTLRRLAVDRARRGEVPVDEAALLESTPDPDPGPEEGLLAAELRQAVREQLAALPPGRQREVFRLRFAEGLPVREIAARLGLHAGTVKVHLFRGTRLLRSRLAGFGEAPGAAGRT